MQSKKSKTDGSRRSKRSKKYVDACFMEDEYETVSEVVAAKGAVYHHLSAREKERLDSMFTRPQNISQERYTRVLESKKSKIVVATGPAGTGKTLFATEYGVRYFMRGTIEKIIFTRPSVAVDEDMGYLPGTLEEKMAPWVRPIYDILYTFMSVKEVTELLEEKKIEIAPLGYMRGRTFKNAWIIADEMQNSTVSQMKMLLTRIGENSRIVITGDLQQHDRGEIMNGLEDFLNKFRGRRSSSITSIEFQSDDIQREEVVKEVLDIYENDCIPPSYQDDPIFITEKAENESTSDLSDDTIPEGLCEDTMDEPDTDCSLEKTEVIVTDVMNMLTIAVEGSA